MNSLGLFILFSGMAFMFVSADEELGKAIAECRSKYPGSHDRTVPDTDFINLPKNDKCYLHCILSAEKLIVDDAFNTGSLRYSLNDEFSTKIRSQCGSIADADKCEFAAKLQKCIQEIIKTTPID